jgi:fumarate hydratase, class II
VIANRALELIGKDRGGKEIHPNDHVNIGQSSNDVIPTAIHVAVLGAISKNLVPALTGLHDKQKAAAFNNIVKIGRTHLNDATPIRLGQEFSGYARQIELAIERIRDASKGLQELALGGTAVGTGINTHPEFAARTIKVIAAETGLPFREAENHFEAQAARDAAVHLSGALKTLAVSLIKITNDIRWLASGPAVPSARSACPTSSRVINHARQSQPGDL